MDRKLIYHPLFEADLIEAANWYDERAKGLGDAFAAEAFYATTIAISHPERFGRLDKNMRFVRIKRFPYIVIFEITDSEVFLFGILHTARSIKKWNRRF